MQSSLRSIIQSCAIAICLIAADQVKAAGHYELYLESWDPSWQPAVAALPPGPNDSAEDSYKGVSLNISFAAYLFTNPEGVPANGANLYGFQFQNFSDVSSVIAFVQGHKGNARISYGGASYAPPFYPNYFISQTKEAGGWPDNIDYLANGVAASLQFNYGSDEAPLYLNGVDFDLEDPQPTTVKGQPYSATDFAKDLMRFLTKVRERIRSDQTLSITIPAQGWGQYWQYLAQKANSATTTVNSSQVPVVDYINFMEYDIWVNGEINAPTQEERYAKQIVADLVTYTSSTSEALPPNWSPGWGINPGKIQLGLMPANDDTGQQMTVTNAANLAAYSMGSDLGGPLYGIMVWDIDRDALTDINPNTPTNPSTLPPNPYTFSQAIREALVNPVSLKKLTKFTKIIGNPRPKAQVKFPPPGRSQNQYPPLHGAP